MRAATAYSYDVNGNLLSVTDALGNVVRISEGGVDFGRHVAGDVLHLFVGLFAGTRIEEIDVIDVAAGAVGHEGDKGRVALAGGIDHFLQGLAIIPIVVG